MTFKNSHSFQSVVIKEFYVVKGKALRRKNKIVTSEFQVANLRIFY